ncbi:MAG TPA: caspase family protein [Pyrinomonadaceae bacterium]
MSKSKIRAAARTLPGALCLVVSLLCLNAVAEARAGGGRRFALLVGINRYRHLPQDKQLEWAVTDAGNVREMLVEEFGFTERDIATLYNENATREGILRALRDAAARAARGDVFVLYYSGHGTLFPDSKSEVLDETQVIEQVVDGGTQQRRRLFKPQKFDSAICPTDVGGPSTSGKVWGNLILDDELFDIFAEFTGRGCEVVLLADSCNSGSLARSAWDSDGGTKYDRPKRVSLRLALGRDWEEIPTPRFQRARTRTASDLDGRFIAITAAKDSELAWESNSGGGYFTQALVMAASGKNNVATFECLYRTLKRGVRERKSIQEPQMDTRFFAGAPTNSLFLSYAEPARLKVLAKITDAYGRDVPDANFALLREGVAPRARFGAGDVLLLGRTDFGGLYDSGCPQVAKGTYWVVAAKRGYRSFEQRVTIEANAPGVAVLRIRLTGL